MSFKYIIAFITSSFGSICKLVVLVTVLQSYKNCFQLLSVGVAICKTTFATFKILLPSLYLLAADIIPKSSKIACIIFLKLSSNCFDLSNIPGGGNQSGLDNNSSMSDCNNCFNFLVSIFKYDIPFSYRSL